MSVITFKALIIHNVLIVYLINAISNEYLNFIKKKQLFFKPIIY